MCVCVLVTKLEESDKKNIGKTRGGLCWSHSERDLSGESPQLYFWNPSSISAMPKPLYIHIISLSLFISTISRIYHMIIHKLVGGFNPFEKY